MRFSPVRFSLLHSLMMIVTFVYSFASFLRSNAPYSCSNFFSFSKKVLNSNADSCIRPNLEAFSIAFC